MGKIIIFFKVSYIKEDTYNNRVTTENKRQNMNTIFAFKLTMLRRGD
jgi:hypothetical protein